MEKKKSNKIEKIGVVVSDKMNKTRVVMVENFYPHPIYKKVIKKRKKFMVHDETNISRNGDIVKIQQTRPLSKKKRWRLVSIIKEAGKLPVKKIEEGLENGSTSLNINSSR